MRIALVAMMLVGLAGASAQVPEETGSKVSRKDAQASLDFQNAKRADVKVPPLEWSPELAGAAQRWADHLAKDLHCGLEHTQRNVYGENLFGGTGRFYTALTAAQSWFAESKDYSAGPLTQENAGKVGHYTQMVWSGSKRVGMGTASCGMGLVIVAEYDPPGNMLGEKPY